MNAVQPVRLALYRASVGARRATSVARFEPTPSRCLIAVADAAHCALDMKVAAGIASLEHYAGFLRVLYRLHRDIDALYANRVLRIALPDLQEWRRLPAIANQLSALRCALPAPGTGLMDVEQAWTTALGWLFVGEAANLYAIALHRLTCRRGLNGSFGNRYPNKTSEVAMQRWRALNGALDTLTMLPTEEEEVIIGAEHAVRQLNHYVRLESP